MTPGNLVCVDTFRDIRYTLPPCELCTETLEIFVSILGAEAGNMALKVLSTGGVYIAGGIPPRILPALRHQHFMQNFLRKGRFTDLLVRMPVHVITNAEHPTIFEVGGQQQTVGYSPAESDSGLFGGNSNWRGPIWFPFN